jgi:hypothetical protein
MKPHKWAKEIKAWADGEIIEAKSIIEMDDWDADTNPYWECCDLEFRIKPQPKEPQYLYVTDGSDGVQFHREKQYQENPAQWNIGKIKLEDE